MRRVLINATVIDCVTPRPIPGASVVIDRGRIVETGDHAGLLRRRGLYARLAKTADLEAEPETAA